jgi:hypothetical protein
MTTFLGIMASSRLLALLLLIPLAACVRATDVRGPNGEDAYALTCSSMAGCADEATQVCHGGGYVIHASSAHEMLISCNSDLPSEPVASAPSSDGPTREDARVCEAAYAYVGDFGAYWVKASHGAALEDAPQKNDFVSVCHQMPDNVQRCMHAKFRDVHASACDAVLSRLDPLSRQRIDGLFLRAQEKRGPKDAPSTAL